MLYDTNNQQNSKKWQIEKRPRRPVRCLDKQIGQRHRPICIKVEISKLLEQRHARERLSDNGYAIADIQHQASLFQTHISCQHAIQFQNGIALQNSVSIRSAQLHPQALVPGKAVRPVITQPAQHLMAGNFDIGRRDPVLPEIQAHHHASCNHLNCKPAEMMPLA